MESSINSIVSSESDHSNVFMNISNSYRVPFDKQLHTTHSIYSPYNQDVDGLKHKFEFDAPVQDPKT